VVNKVSIVGIKQRKKGVNIGSSIEKYFHTSSLTILIYNTEFHY